jgi:hypothetical protein
MSGRNFCVSFAAPQDLKTCLQIGQSVMLDNGAFSTFTRGEQFIMEDFFAWVEPMLGHPHWAIVPDVIGGSMEDQKLRLKAWPFPKELGAPVWHLGLPVEYLLELCDEWPRVCLGSSAEYWNVGGDKWCHRMDEAFNYLASKRRYLPWIHGLRMLGMAGERWPLASADSTNIAQNFKKNSCCAERMAVRLDSVQCPTAWNQIETQGNLCL